MCEICRQSPCSSQCPNAPEEKPVCTCDHCGEDIFVGDEYAEIDGEVICFECLDNMSTKQLLEIMNIDVEKASRS